MVIPSLFVAFMAWALGPAPVIAGFEPEAKSYLFLLGIALLLGFCVVALRGHSSSVRFTTTARSKTVRRSTPGIASKFSSEQTEAR